MFNVFLDTIEIRIDDYFIEAVLLFVGQIMPFFKNLEELNLLMFINFKPLREKIEDKIKDNNN